jgi:N-acetylmuramoyl-L-alanine amidase
MAQAMYIPPMSQAAGLVSKRMQFFQRAGTAFSLLALGLCVIGEALAAPAVMTHIKDVRISATNDTTRVVFDVSQPVSPRVFVLDNPRRVVVDIVDAQLDLTNGWPTAQGFIKEFRPGSQGNGTLRVVLDVGQSVETRSFSVEPAEGLGHRLVLDLLASKVSSSNVATNSAATQVTAQPASLTAASPVKITELGRVLVVAIDPGHGGQDPGASGRKGTREKEITLAIARKLKARIDDEPGMRAVLTRDSDIFVPLRERIVRARRQQADIFVSIHADAVRDRSVTGSSVYVLSAGRATNEAARMLADRENAADLMGDMTLENKDDVLASVLLDMSQGASMSASNEAAARVLSQLDKLGDVLDTDVKHASLKVLTSPDMPSMLVETAFISNPKEEAKLKDVRHQQALADAILAGVRAYFYENPPPGTQVAQLAAQRNRARGASMTINASGVAP